MAVQPVTEKNEYNSVLARQPHAQFLQSWEWGVFQQAPDKQVWRWRDASTGSVGQAFLQQLPGGFSYIYAPRLTHSEGNDFFQQSLEFLREKAREVGAVFVRLEPTQLPEKLSLRPVESMQPADTMLVNVRQGEQQLLLDMKPKTRYNIRLAQRKGVTVTTGVNEKSIRDFLQLMKQTESRHDLSAHGSKYYEKLLRLIPQEPASPAESYVTLLSAQSGGRTLAAHLLIGFGDTLTYLFGASSDQDKNLMAPYLLQWEAIRLAASHHYTYYDFFGIAPESTDAKPGAEKRRAKWAGISRFKVSFGGEKQHYPGAFDLVNRGIWYRLYRTWQQVRPG